MTIMMIIIIVEHLLQHISPMIYRSSCRHTQHVTVIHKKAQMSTTHQQTSCLIKMMKKDQERKRNNVLKVFTQYVLSRVTNGVLFLGDAMNNHAF